MTSSAGLVLGYDFGTTSVKAALFDCEGNVITDHRVAYPLYMPEIGWAEQRPDDWWRAMREVTHALLSTEEGLSSRVVALAVSAQMGGAVPVDRNGRVLHDALIWLDTRSAALAERIVGGSIRINGYGLGALARWLWLTNGVPNREGRDPTSKFLWFREEMPELWADVHKLLDVKDYLLHRLTGRFATTPDCAHLTWLMDARPGRRRWSPALLRRIGLDARLLPEIVPGDAAVGTLTAEAAEALSLPIATLVAAGGGDLNAFALGAGTYGNRDWHLHIGTSNWWGCHRDSRKVNIRTGIGTIAATDAKRYVLVAAQESAGACVEWAARLMHFRHGGDIDFTAFDQAASAVPMDLDSPFFYPWLHGERVPVDSRNLRAGFSNLSLSHDRSALARAVLEGVAFNIRWAFEAMRQTAGTVSDAVRFVGGGAKSAVWGQILSDVLQRPLKVMERPELSGALGAAMTAAIAAGWFDDLEAATVMARIDVERTANGDLAPLYDARFARFLRHAKHAA